MPPAPLPNDADPLAVPEPAAILARAEDPVNRRVRTPAPAAPPPPPTAPPPPPPPAAHDGSLSDLERALVGSIKEYHLGLTAALDRNTTAIESMSKALSRFALVGILGGFALVVFLVAILALTRGVDPRVAADAADKVLHSVGTGQ